MWSGAVHAVLVGATLVFAVSFGGPLLTLRNLRRAIPVNSDTSEAPGE